LLDYDTDKGLVNQVDDDNNTALLVAAEAGHLDVVKMLVAEGADMSIRNYDRKTIFDLAMRHNNNSLLHYLIEVRLCS